MNPSNAVLRGCLIGFSPILGAIIGFTIGIGDGNVSAVSSSGIENIFNALIGAGIGGVLGLVVGIVISLSIKNTNASEEMKGPNKELNPSDNDLESVKSHETQYQSPTIISNPPKNWMIESILATIFCCLPFGIVAIVNANSVNLHIKNGDLNKANKASKDAKTWLIVSIAVGLFFGSIYLVPSLFSMF